MGKDNKFGHPSDITLECLNRFNCKVYRTDEDGEISIDTNGKSLKVNRFIK